MVYVCMLTCVCKGKKEKNKCPGLKPGEILKINFENIGLRNCLYYVLNCSSSYISEISNEYSEGIVIIVHMCISFTYNISKDSAAI